MMMAMPSINCISIHFVDFKGLYRQRGGLPGHHDKGLRTGEATPSCSWDIPEGPGLALSCSNEASMAKPSLKDVASITEDIVDY